MNPDSQLLHQLRGPLIMITIGVLFLLDNMTPLHFGKTWPIILIVAGALALGGSRRGPAPPPPPGGWR